MNHDFSLASVPDERALGYCSCGWIGASAAADSFGFQWLRQEWLKHRDKMLQIEREAKDATQVRNV